MIRLIGFAVVGAGIVAIVPAAGLGVIGLILGHPVPLTPHNWALEACVMAISNNHVLREVIHVKRRLHTA